jgi:hypothetical protein
MNLNLLRTLFLSFKNYIVNSILYFNVLTQQLQEPITKSAQEDKISFIFFTLHYYSYF